MANLTIPERVLVLDGDMNVALTITRSLARIGLEVDIASHVPRPISGHSRHVRNTLVYPDPLKKENEFVDWCRRKLDNPEYALVIPVTERSLVPLIQLNSHPNAALLALPAPDALRAALDKSLTLKLANQFGIPSPHSRLIEAANDIDAVMDEFGLPVVIKPARSIGTGETGRKQLRVEYAFSCEELRTKTAHFLHFGPVLIQEYIAGQGVGIELIAEHGKIKYVFQHVRLHETPLTGGGSSFRISASPEPQLVEASTKLMEALGWHGVAMVEFKWNAETKTFALMEINGRFWGSLPLAVAAGADFPVMLYELLHDGHIKDRPPARTGIYCRKLSSDIYWYEQVLRKDAPQELVQLPDARSLIGDLLKIFLPRHYFDIQSWSDPLPGIIDIGHIIGKYTGRIGNLIGERLALLARKKDWRTGKAQRRIKQARQILFLCYGNINRSALAERTFLATPPPAGIRVISAGFHQEEGRPADPVMIKAAAQAGIDMNNWVSRRLTEDMVNTSDAILVMELHHYQELTARFPEARNKTFLLGMAAGEPGDDEIADPYGKPFPAYSRCVRDVTTNVRKVAELTKTLMPS